jgi:hypothetical protein
MTARHNSRKSDLPPLRIHYLLYFLAVAAFAAAMHRGVKPVVGPDALGRELAEMTYWLAAALGASVWALGACWCMRGRRFLIQPGPWLVAASLVETGYLGRLAAASELLVLGRAGPVAAWLRESWETHWWSVAPLAILGAIVLGVSASPSRRTAFGPLWRVLLALVGVQLLACAFVGPWNTELGRWQGWRLSTWEARSRAAAAIAAAAVMHDRTRGRRRHWSHALSVALWMAMLLGRNLALGD